MHIVIPNLPGLIKIKINLLKSIYIGPIAKKTK